MNWQVVKDLVAYGKNGRPSDKHFRFTLTTNGVLLNDEVQEFVNKEMDNVVLSLDGRKVNDRNASVPGMEKGYDLIVRNSETGREQKSGKVLYTRTFITREKSGLFRGRPAFCRSGI